MLELLQQPAALLRAGVVHINRPDVPHVGINRIAEHEQLADGNEEREEQRLRVAKDMQQFLAGDGEGALQGEGGEHGLNVACTLRPQECPT